MKDFKVKIEEHKKRFEKDLSRAKDEKSLQEVRNAFMSRKRGELKLLFEELKTLKPEEKAAFGQMVNDLKIHIQEKIRTREKLKVIKKASAALKASSGKIDLTLPGQKEYWGSPHPIALFQQEMENIFIAMGFSIEDGPEIETDYYNFEALNFPPHHPARDDWHTLYITDDLLLRTHTSPVQIRAMEKRKPPIRIIIPGKVYRRETPDPTHLPCSTSLKGLLWTRASLLPI